MWRIVVAVVLLAQRATSVACPQPSAFNLGPGCLLRDSGLAATVCCTVRGEGSSVGATPTAEPCCDTSYSSSSDFNYQCLRGHCADQRSTPSPVSSVPTTPPCCRVLSITGNETVLETADLRPDQFFNVTWIGFTAPNGRGGGAPGRYRRVCGVTADGRSVWAEENRGDNLLASHHWHLSHNRAGGAWILDRDNDFAELLDGIGTAHNAGIPSDAQCPEAAVGPWHVVVVNDANGVMSGPYFQDWPSFSVTCVPDGADADDDDDDGYMYGDGSCAPTSAPSTAPSTSAPVTSAPVTSTPVTSTPATSAPVTAPPVTSAPITGVPTTAPPVTSTPATSAPVTSAPVTSAPTTGVPTTGVPTTAPPATSIPTAASPTAASPVTPSPATPSPATPAPTLTPRCTPFQSVDSPGGAGDYENHANHGTSHPDTCVRFFGADYAPISVDCRTVTNHVPYNETGQNVSCTVGGGSRCKNNDNERGHPDATRPEACLDYEVSWCCADSATVPTRAPTTSAPMAPTTAVPASPTTVAPTTSTPTTSAPTASTTLAPATLAPTTLALTSTAAPMAPTTIQPTPMVSEGDLTCDSTVTGSLPLSPPYGSSAGEHMYLFTIAVAQRVTVDACESQYDTMLWLSSYDGATPLSSTHIAHNNDNAAACGGGSSNYTSHIEHDLVPGTYAIVVGSPPGVFSAAEGTYAITLGCQVPTASTPCDDLMNCVVSPCEAGTNPCPALGPATCTNNYCGGCFDVWALDADGKVFDANNCTDAPATSPTPPVTLAPAVPTNAVTTATATVAAGAPPGPSGAPSEAPTPTAISRVNGRDDDDDDRTTQWTFIFVLLLLLLCCCLYAGWHKKEQKRHEALFDGGAQSSSRVVANQIYAPGFQPLGTEATATRLAANQAYSLGLVPLGTVATATANQQPTYAVPAAIGPSSTAIPPAKVGAVTPVYHGAAEECAMGGGGGGVGDASPTYQIPMHQGGPNTYATLDASGTYATARAPQGAAAAAGNSSYAVLNRKEGTPPVQACPSPERGGLFKSVLADAHGSELPMYDVPNSSSDGQKGAAAPGMHDNAAYEASTA